MALSDPQELPGTPVIECAAIGATVGKYANDDSTYEIEITHNTSASNRTRSTQSVKFSKISADPLLPSNNRVYDGTIRIITDFPVQGFTLAEKVALYDRAVAYAAEADHGAKVIGGQA